MKSLLLLVVLSILFLSTSFSNNAHAWGGRGHATICEAATFLVKEPTLKKFLSSKGHMMTYLCNIPDTYWRSLSPEASKLGNPTHFIDVEITGLKVDQIPLDYKKVQEEFTGKPNKLKEGAKIFSVPTEFGSLWWRVDQFVRRTESLKLDLANIPVSNGGKKENLDDSPYNKAVLAMIINMGIMGHFVGDSAQPMHTTADYDGYLSGHGGLHSYYEEASVSLQGSDLLSDVTKAAMKIKSAPFLTAKTPIEKIRAISLISASDLPNILKLDPIKKQSIIKSDKGMEIKTPAEREDAEVGAKKFKNSIVKNMANASILLANLWDESFVRAGKPDLSKYRSFVFPHTPEFIPPDYLATEEKTETKK